ncbi:biofilm PGA synthesis lipoprotein PgaB [Modicisalibacter ilicicola DSM 19980]|uniref:Biofilm PGA synthesis lipoprotein PgaB n=1 Tax=Modicisalibacter ilicicola DSM 19980 TaxID=1121942 RepID=A0A1M5EJD7_9GAMM|nr:poly-beta-1,6-N-acetyl-D-glucosamine N-deacetylase PgaB [Halomonas ilicicola]SHF79254.1 biofilm PGA synthesis lipoprotein PgaB [Halomonas ilicicola DSM 19980]
MSKWIAALLACVLAMPALAGEGPAEYSVISYHDIIDVAQTPDMKVYPQTITRDMLVRHFNLIDDLGYEPVSFQQVLDAKAGKSPLPDKAVLLTFDDGYRSVHDIVFPLLKLYDFPAVVAPVGSWMEVPEGGEVPYGNIMLPRERFMSWEQLRELNDSPLVEIASHTHDLHYGIIGNPQGNEQPAATTPKWTPAGYESEQEYLERVRNDLTRARDQLERELGEAPRIIIWPYGAYSEAVLDIAGEVGMPHTFSLLAKINDTDESTRAMGRYLVDQETSLELFEEYLAGRTWKRKAERVVHVDLDYVFDPDKAQQGRNLDKLLDEIKAQGISTVYLQAYADVDGDGVAEGLYFPNAHLPVKADLFNRVAWQLKKRAEVKVYAWMPVMAFDLGRGHDYVSDVRLGKPNPEHYKRLSPYVERNREIIKDIYRDLGLYTKFDGVLFHDDAFLSDFEDASLAARNWYRQEWGLPDAVTEIRRDDALMTRWTRRKTRFLIDFTHALGEQANHYRMLDNDPFALARNIYARPILEPESQRWFAQDLEAFAEAYDYTAVMAMPYMEGADDPDAWLRKLARVSLDKVPADRLVFELQAQDWRDQTPIPSEQLAHWMRVIRQAGIENYGYYPHDFLNDHPDTSILRRDFSLSSTLEASR